MAVFGGLCALATFDRSDLKTDIFENSDCKQFLELVPQVRELLYSFYNSKYTIALDILDSLKVCPYSFESDLNLDIFLSEFVNELATHIRKRALVQYFSPFNAVNLNTMALAFKTHLHDLEKELVALISLDLIHARIDSHEKILVAKKQNERKSAYAATKELVEEYQQACNLILMRAQLVRNDIVVRSVTARTD